MRWALLAAVSMAAISGLAPSAFAQAQAKAPRATAIAATQSVAVDETIATSTLLSATTPANALADRTYTDVEAALLAADLDYVVREGRRALARGEQDPMWTIAVFADDVAGDRLAEARSVLESAPGGIGGPLADMLEPFLIAAEGRADRGVERLDSGNDNLPAPLPEVARALVFESAGRLEEAAAIYALMAEGLDLTPPGDNEPASMEEFQRSLAAARTTHAIYRSALVHHRLGRTDEARRLYGIVQGFAPRSIDVIRNLERLDAGQPPNEAPLDAKRALGRWMLFLSEFLTQAESLSAVLNSEDPTPGLDSDTGTALLQIGVLLAQDADDWRLHAASQLIAANGLEGAERVIDQTSATSVFSADANITRATIQIERRNAAAAIQSADRAMAEAGDRWPLIASAADIYRRADRPEQAEAAFTRVLSMVTTDKDRADVLGWRAFAHRYAGNMPAATRDARAAFELDQGLNTRLLYISILMDDANGWRDGIRVARALFAEQPDSVMRLNALGYALIQRPEGLEEGYRLLWRGYTFGQQDNSVVDSLGWAYYLYGRFDDALTLIERANALSANEPNAEILDHLGDVYWRLNRRDEARDAWRQALEAWPDAIRRRDIEAKLANGLRTAAPRQRELPRVTLPTSPGQRDSL